MANRLFDYNSSFLLMRTNPALSGNIKITVNSKGSLFFNSIDADPLLSNAIFKNYAISGQNSYAQDLYSFFQNGQVDPSVVFKVGKTTEGAEKSASKYVDQYDHLYWSGAQTLADRSYSEDFSYFAPLWLESELPDFFVIFKVPDPLSYKYSDNVTSISEGARYKVVKKFGTTTDFIVNYGFDSLNQPVQYTDGDFFTGVGSYDSYTVFSGEGSVIEFNELKNLNNAEDAETYFNEKILPNCQIVKTFDLRENTPIGGYIRNIFNTITESYSPVDINFGSGAFSYFNGIDYRSGTYSRASEMLRNYFISSDSTPQIDLENYVTSGFSRNGIICPSLLNLEFLFDDEYSEDYTINRYFGAYVSRNDLGEFLLNGDFLFNYRNSVFDENYPKPPRNSFGYYYDNNSFQQSATSGVRLYYQGASGYLPGSNDVNNTESLKLFYVTDKNENLYSLKRVENWNSGIDASSEYGFGPYSQLSDSFGVTGSTGANSGSFVIQNQSVDLLNFTGLDDKVITASGFFPNNIGNSYIDVDFLKNWDLKEKELVFKIYWPLGSRSEGPDRFDLIKSGDFSGSIVWRPGSTYSVGNNYFINAEDGTPKDFASAFSSAVYSISNTIWDSAVIGSSLGITGGTGSTGSTSVIKIKKGGSLGNSTYKLSIFDNYVDFESRYEWDWSPTYTYVTGSIVKYGEYYYEALSNITGDPDNLSPSDILNNLWSIYTPVSSLEYFNIEGEDPAASKRIFSFKGGTEKKSNRVVFSSENSNQIIVDNWIRTTDGFSKIVEIGRYLEEPIYRGNESSDLVIDFKNYNKYLVAVTENDRKNILIGNDLTFDVYSKVKHKVGVLTFFDFKDFDFDFWSSIYGVTPNYETYRYFQLLPDTDNAIQDGVDYVIKQGKILYNGTRFYDGQSFRGVSGASSFTALDGYTFTPVVFPVQFSSLSYGGSGAYYKPDLISYEKDLNSFDGFIGIRSVDDLRSPDSTRTKIENNEIGLIDNEYEYLKENYTPERANVSRIVPYINKWRYKDGTDSRGNEYRLNLTPAFTPTNFSPTFRNYDPDPDYLTHEWFLLESVPRQFPKEFTRYQNSYLSSKLDYSKMISVSSDDLLYLSEYFTVVPDDYSSEIRDTKDEVKELFSAFTYNSSTGFYETLFRGCKVVLKKRSDSRDAQSDQSGFSKYVPEYRGYDGYRYSCILRVLPETSDTIQSPVSYKFIENAPQKFIVMLIDVVANDYKLQPLGYTGGTGGDPVIDYTLLYSLSDKNSLLSPQPSNKPLYSIGDIKLSCALDLSPSSNSDVDESTDPGRVYFIENPDYKADLREEVNVFYPIEIAQNLSFGITGITGSFYVPDTQSYYPWPVGAGEEFIEFGSTDYNGRYNFSLPFADSKPTIPVGSRTYYAGSPVFQLSAGDKYFDFIGARTAFSYVAEKINNSDPYVDYLTYDLNQTAGGSKEISSDFEIYFDTPSYIYKPLESRSSKIFSETSTTVSFRGGVSKGPKGQVQNVPTGYQIFSFSENARPSELLRFSGPYDPIFNKLIFFKNDKNDTVSGTGVDLSFRNCTFSPNTYYFGKIKNLSFTKVSSTNILSLSQNLPQGPSFPLVNQTPVSRKDFNVFQSNWDPGYYNSFFSAANSFPVAGTKSMVEFKNFMGSKMMKTPKNIIINNYVTLPISRNFGSSDVAGINSFINSSLQDIDSITSLNSAQGIGSAPTYLSNVDLASLSQNIFQNAEIFWQKPDNIKTVASLRLDRMLRRYLMNAGAGDVFFRNIISEFGVGDPSSLQDDVLEYIRENIIKTYEMKSIQLYVKKTGAEDFDYEDIVRGDVVSTDRGRLGYVEDKNFNITLVNDLVYNFEYRTDPNFQYSFIFRFVIDKI